MSPSVLLAQLVVIAAIAALLRISPRVPTRLYAAHDPARADLSGDQSSIISRWHQATYRIPTWSVFVFAIPAVWVAVRYAQAFAEMDLLDGSLTARLGAAAPAIAASTCALVVCLALTQVAAWVVRHIGDINVAHLARLLACIGVVTIGGFQILEAMARAGA